MQQCGVCEHAVYVSYTRQQCGTWRTSHCGVYHKVFLLVVSYVSQCGVCEHAVCEWVCVCACVCIIEWVSVYMYDNNL